MEAGWEGEWRKPGLVALGVNDEEDRLAGTVALLLLLLAAAAVAAAAAPAASLG